MDDNKTDMDMIRKKYPKALKVFKEYISPAWLIGTDEEELTEDSREEILDDVAELTIVNAPRSLYDFFDKQDIFLYLDHDMAGDKNYVFGYIINVPNKRGGLDVYYDEETQYKSRSEAEKAGYLEAFKLLEEKL